MNSSKYATSGQWPDFIVYRSRNLKKKKETIGLQAKFELENRNKTKIKTKTLHRNNQKKKKIGNHCRHKTTKQSFCVINETVSNAPPALVVIDIDQELGTLRRQQNNFN